MIVVTVKVSIDIDKTEITETPKSFRNNSTLQLVQN